MENTKLNCVPILRHRVLAALASIVIGIAATGILAGGKSIFERSRWGQESDVWVFELLQGFLSSDNTNNPVVLIDISDVHEDSAELLARTSEIVRELRHLDKRPIAVGIDVDFSPEGALTNDATDFFDSCLKRTDDDVPIYLGVGNNKSASPQQWLGLDKYRELAAAVAINRNDTRWIPIWLQANNQSEKLRTINYSLALEKRHRLPGPPAWVGEVEDWNDQEHEDSREQDQAEDGVVLHYGERLVNYSKLEAMTMAAKKDIDSQSLKRDAAFYAGKLVIVGDVDAAITPGSDLFAVAGFRDNQPGSLLLASAAYTLVKEPLYEFKPKKRLIIDFVIAGIVIGMVALSRFRDPIGSSWLGLQAILVYVFILVVIVAGFLLVRLAGVMWLDFLLVSFALFLHPKMEQLIHWLLSKLKALARPERRPPTSRKPTAMLTCLLIMLTLTGIARAQQPEEICKEDLGVAAVLLRVEAQPKQTRARGRCQFRINDGEKMWHDLSEADMMKRLRAYQNLRCDRGCTLVIHLCGSVRDEEPPIKYFQTKNAGGNVPGWYTVINANKTPRRIIDRNPDIPAKKIKWISLRPQNPLTESSSGEVAMYDEIVGEQSASSGRRIGGMLGSANAIPKSSPTPAHSQSEIQTGEAMGARSRSKTDFSELRDLMISFRGLITKGNTERDAKNYAAAEHAYLDAAKLVPNDAISWYGLGNVYFDQKKWNEAEKAYKTAISFGTVSPEVYLALATVLIDSTGDALNADKLSEAEGYLWTLVNMEPEYEEGNEMLYAVLEKRGATSAEYEAAYRRMLRLNSDSFSANLRLNSLLLRSGRREEARKHLLTAEKVGQSAQQMLQVAEVFESQKEYERAERLARRAIALDPDNAHARLLMGIILIDAEHYSSSISWLEHAIELDPNDFVAQYLLGIARLHSGLLGEAERNFDEATKKFSPPAEELSAIAYWLSALGDAYGSLGRRADAIRAYEKALRCDPNDWQASDRLSKIRASVKP